MQVRLPYMLTRDDAEHLAARAADWTGWHHARTVPMEARRLGDGRWKYAYGAEIRPAGSKARGLVRRSGWCVTYEVDSLAGTEVFPSIRCVRVFDDGTVELEDG